MTRLEAPADKRLVLYDGVCALCNRWVEFILRRDRRDRFRFAALQSDGARALLTAHGRDPDALDTVVVVVGPGTDRERLLTRSSAGLHILASLGGVYRLAALGRLVPRPVRDWVYDRIARSRYERYGKYDACPVPAPEHRHKFV